MSWQASAWADSLEYGLVGPLATRVLFKLANAAMADGSRAWRSKADVALELGVSQRSVQRAFKELEMAALIKPGDQEFVHHIRADRRPTVYDMNLHYKTEYELPELPIDGETELSTGGSRGDTPGLNGETTVVAHRTILELLKPTTQPNHRSAPDPINARCVAKRPHQWPDDDDESACTVNGCGMIRYQYEAEIARRSSA